MTKSIQEINEKIKKGQAVIVTAEEMISIVQQQGTKKAAERVDVVTTGTFGPMCSSGAYFNFGHSKPKIKIGGGHVTLNDIPAYAGLAAVDVFLGCTAVPDIDYSAVPRPIRFPYGGGHVIHDLVAGKDLLLKANSYGTDCYPRKEIETRINLKEMNEAILFNPRNGYQNYNAAVNLSDKTIYTYMGVLRPNSANINYCSAGQLSPLLNDPLYRTIGIGTRIFLGGAIGYVSWWGTQHNPLARRGDNDVPKTPAGTLALIGDLKQMNPEWLVGMSFPGYGATMAVGIGIPIPVLDEQMAFHTAVKDSDIYTQIVDYSRDYPNGIANSLGEISYAELRSGTISFQGKKIPTACFSNYKKAVKIAGQLKEWIQQGHFLLSEPVEKFPGKDSDYKIKGLTER
jgi:uncharacterized protein (DUF39 family)